MPDALLSRAAAAPNDGRLFFFLPALWFLRFFPGGAKELDPPSTRFVDDCPVPGCGAPVPMLGAGGLWADIFNHLGCSKLGVEGAKRLSQRRQFSNK